MTSLPAGRGARPRSLSAHPGGRTGPTAPRPGPGRDVRHLVWFSCGAASAVAALLTLRSHPETTELHYCDPGSEHPDNRRFLADVSEWLGSPVHVHQSSEYRDTWDVWERTRFIIGPGGARCTVELKKRLRQAEERPDDLQVFGYTVDERGRIDRFRAANPDVNLEVPLVDAGLSKADCLGVIESVGIDLPAMYQLGYRNANCIGCPHGSMGYWNMIRRDFPVTFDRMARLERDLDHACCRPGGTPVFLDQLAPDRGDIRTEPEIECSLLCAGVTL